MNFPLVVALEQIASDLFAILRNVGHLAMPDRA
jgi:hypothetical protein